MFEAPTLKRSIVRLPDLPLQTMQQPLWQRWWPYAVIICLVTLFDLTQIAHNSVWFDESDSINIAFLSWDDWWRWVWTFGNQNMMLYYVILRAWLWFTDALHLMPNDTIVRLPSLVFGVSTIVVVFALGRRFFSDTVAWLAVVLYALSSNLVYYSHEARSYSLFFLLNTSGWYCLFTLLSMTEKKLTKIALRWWFAYVAVMALAVYAHLIATLDIMTQVAFVVAIMAVPNPWQQQARQSMLPFEVATLAMVLLIAPIEFNAHIRGVSSEWLPSPTFKDLRLFFINSLSGYNVGLTWAFYVLVAIGFCLSVGSFVLRNDSRWLERLQPGYVKAAGDLSAKVLGLTCWFLLPSALAFVLSRWPLHQHLFFHATSCRRSLRWYCLSQSVSHSYHGNRYAS